jgi:purine-nucleoside phosphorylase
MQGRLHYYEGYTLEQVVYPLRALAYSGCQTFILTNASGGLLSDMVPGDLVLISDHINLMGNNPLIGQNLEILGQRFPDMTEVYDKSIRKLLIAIAKEKGISLREGVYLGIAGPSYETPAEIQMYRKLGADLVGMSTVPEAIALKHMRKKVVALACVTNLAAGLEKGPLVHTDVLENAKKGQEAIHNILWSAIPFLAGEVS